MPKRKYQKPAVDLEINQTLERFALADPKEVGREVATDQQDRVRLVQREEGGRPLIIYNGDEGAKVALPYHRETFWATQLMMAEMFGVTRENVTIHLGNIFREGELVEEAVCKESLLSAADGKHYPTKEYNLNAIISVGYRVGSVPGTIFRIWATGVSCRFLQRDFTLTSSA